MCERSHSAGPAVGPGNQTCASYGQPCITGVKTSAVINVGTATISAFIGAGGFGERIAQGLALNDNATLLAGAVPAAALALLVHGGFELLDRWLMPAGLRDETAVASI